MTVTDRSNLPASQAVRRPGWEIRPGIHFPEWSAIRSLRAESALKDILDLLRIERCWDRYGHAEDQLRQIILRHYGTRGRAPTLDTLAELAGLPQHDVRSYLTRLHERDLVVFDADQDHVAGAYPFTNHPTEHRVLFDGLTVNAMCAIDALGAGRMYERDARVVSRCRACGLPISIETRADGTALASVSPEGAVVWSGLRYADNCAASSLCTVIAFFCSDQDLEEWRTANHPDIRGHRLSMEEAHEVGMAIFAPMLATASS